MKATGFWADNFVHGDGFYLQDRGGRDLCGVRWDDAKGALDYFDSEVGVKARVVRVSFSTVPPTIRGWTKWLEPMI